MTPLATRVLKQYLAAGKRTMLDYAGLLEKGRLADLHCFDVTEVQQLANELRKNISSRNEIDERMSFLPAPKTWIEFRDSRYGGPGISAYFLEEYGPLVRVTEIYGNGRVKDMIVSERCGTLNINDPSQPLFFSQMEKYLKQGGFNATDLAHYLLGFLAIINTPRIIGRRQHMPHRGLERRLLKARRSIGYFPLRAWTEIKLCVTPPEDISDKPSIEAHLTGKRALHYCRAHLRIRLGRLEIVRGHWRGDGSLGIKRSRYKVLP